MCPHNPHCPDAAEPDREAARVISGHPEQGWSLLCNGLIVFEDTGNLLPDCTIVAPHRAKPGCKPGQNTGCLPEQTSRRRRKARRAA
jgi:hypothetical protein